MRYDRSTMPTNDSPSERYRQLVMWLRDQYRGARGWQAQAARRLNVHPVTLSKFLTGDRSTVGLDIIERAILSLPIDREYFFSPHPSSDPGLWMFPRDRPGAPAEDGETERFFWLTVSTKIGPSPLNREKLAELDEETLEMVASERRFFARYFAENFPEVVEARRLANATARELLDGWDNWIARVERLFVQAHAAAATARPVLQATTKAPPRETREKKRTKPSAKKRT